MTSHGRVQMLLEHRLQSQDFLFPFLHRQLGKTAVRRCMRLRWIRRPGKLAQVIPVADRFVGFDASIERVTPSESPSGRTGPGARPMGAQRT